MTLDELTDFLAKATAVDARVETNEFAYEMWRLTVGHLRADDALAALVDHHQKSTERVMPADIVRGAKVYSEARWAALPTDEETMADCQGLHHGLAVKLYQRRRRAMADDGLSLAEARAAYPPPPHPEAITSDSTDGDVR